MDPSQGSLTSVGTPEGGRHRAKWLLVIGHFGFQFNDLFIPKGQTVEGFVHTHQDYGVKYVSAVRYHPGWTKEFEFIVEVPGIKADYKQTDFDQVVPPYSVREGELEGLRRTLETYTCCVLGPDGKTPGDPLNIVVAGPAEKFSTRSFGATGI